MWNGEGIGHSGVMLRLRAPSRPTVGTPSLDGLAPSTGLNGPSTGRQRRGCREVESKLHDLEQGNMFVPHTCQVVPFCDPLNSQEIPCLDRGDPGRVLL